MKKKICMSVIGCVWLLVLAAASTVCAQVIYSEDFETNTLGEMQPVSVTSNADWHVYEYYGDHFARINGYGADTASNDWLITRQFNLDFFTNEVLTFETAYNFDGPALEVLISTDYDPAVHADPGTATWTNLNPTLPTTGGYAFVSSGAIDLSAVSGGSVSIGFHYVSTGIGGGDGRVWEVDNIVLSGTYAPSEVLEEDFDSGIGSFSAFSRASNKNWGPDRWGGQDGAFCNGYGADVASDDWLISPAMALTADDYAVLSFKYYHYYSGPELTVKVSTKYSGTGDPLAPGVVWDDIPVDFSGASGSWHPSGDLDISAYIGSAVYIAFVYTSTGTGSGDGRSWGVDTVTVSRSLPGTISVDFVVNPTTATTIETIAFVPFVSGGTGPYTYLWDFGNGDISADESPVYTYPAAGVYTVSLTVTDADSNESVQTKTGYITVNQATSEPVPAKLGDIRVAAFNAYLNRGAEGDLVADLSGTDNEQVRKVAEIIQRVRPDIVLLNEIDYVADGSAIDLLRSNYLEIGQNGADPITYDYVFIAESNTGIPSGFDLNNSGTVGGADDCFGYGAFYGQYAMALLSRFPIAEDQIRTFQHFLWQDMPGAIIPPGYYTVDELAVFRLSSKSHWDVPIDIDGEMVHVLCSHPTPPVFDGSEDRNGRRNHDEIRLWADYITAAGSYIYDDEGLTGPLGDDQRFVIVGDQNADPVDGDSTDDAILQLLNNPAVDATLEPVSNGACEQSDDCSDTASWGLRADYVLPSDFGLRIVDGGVYWPVTTDVNYHLVDNDASSDHRLVWMDLDLTAVDVIITPEEGGQGTQLLIEGSGFGERVGRVTIGGRHCRILSWSDTCITCEIGFSFPEGLYDVIITPRGFSSEPIVVEDGFTIIENPFAKFQITPEAGGRGTEVTITGENFGSLTGRVVVGGRHCRILSWSDTVIRFRIGFSLPAGVYDITIMPRGLFAEPTVLANGFTME